MRKAYQSLFVEVDYLEDEDILTTSPDGNGVMDPDEDPNAWT